MVRGYVWGLGPGQWLEQWYLPWILIPKGGCPSKNHRHLWTQGHHRDTAPTQGGAKEVVTGGGGWDGRRDTEKECERCFILLILLFLVAL